MHHQQWVRARERSEGRATDFQPKSTSLLGSLRWNLNVLKVWCLLKVTIFCFQLFGTLVILLPFLSREARFIGWGFLSTTVSFHFLHLSLSDKKWKWKTAKNEVSLSEEMCQKNLEFVRKGWRGCWGVSPKLENSFCIEINFVN